MILFLRVIIQGLSIFIFLGNIVSFLLEGCPRGLRSTLGKRVYVKAYRGFESHSLRQFISAFNRCLTEILSHQITKENIVVATDESIICDEKARELLKSEFTVYLKVSLPLQLERISDFVALKMCYISS